MVLKTDHVLTSRLWFDNQLDDQMAVELVALRREGGALGAAQRPSPFSRSDAENEGWYALYNTWFVKS